MNDDLPNLLTPEQLSKRLTVTAATLGNWRARGTGPKWIRMEGQIRYNTKHVIQWLDAESESF